MGRLPTAVCVGESMAALLPDRPGPLEEVATFHHSTGGAESNVACGLVALGIPTAWVSRVGDDGVGRRMLRALEAAGVDTTAVVVDRSRPTGLYVKEIGAAGSVLHYYRSGSAAAALGPELLDQEPAAPLLGGADLIHLSGITAALSDTALGLVRAILERRHPGRLVSFDLNWRPTLWRDRDPSALRPLLDAADIVLLGADEATDVFGTGDPAELRELLPRPETLVVKESARHALAVDGSGVTAEPALAVEVVDEVGAGDAFAAGYLAGTLRGYDQHRRLRLGHLAAAATLVIHGDHGPLPPAGLIERLLAATPGEWAATTVRADGWNTPVDGRETP